MKRWLSRLWRALRPHPHFDTWVVAATRSRLGFPGVEYSDNFDDCGGGLLFSWSNDDVTVEVAFDRSIAVVEWRGNGSAEFRTPRELRRELDLIAKERARTE